MQLFLGHGNFGSVVKGVYSMSGASVAVAIKTLKTEDIPNQEVTFIGKSENPPLKFYHFNIFCLFIFHAFFTISWQSNFLE